MEVLVEFDYVAEEADELSIKKGDIVKDVSQFEEGWFIGSLRGKIGVFPDNFVKLPTAGDAPSETKPDAIPPDSMDDENRHDGAGRPQRLTGIGLGNIFSGQPIQLKPVSLKEVKKEVEQNADSTAKNAPNTQEEEPSTVPSVQPDLVRAQYKYQQRQSDELELMVNDVIQVLERDLPDEGWWKGKNLRTQKVGMFPDNFVSPYTDSNSDGERPPTTQITPTATKTNARPVPSILSGTTPNGAPTFSHSTSVTRANPSPVTSPTMPVSSTATSINTTAVNTSSDPPRIATKPLTTTAITHNTPNGGPRSVITTATLATVGGGTREGTKVAVANAPGRVGSMGSSLVPVQTAPAPTSGNGVSSEPFERNTHAFNSARGTNKWKINGARAESTERPKSRADEMSAREGDPSVSASTAVDGAASQRLTGLTTERPKQSGRRLPSKFNRPVTPNSEAATEIPISESDRFSRDAHPTRSQVHHMPRGGMLHTNGLNGRDAGAGPGANTSTPTDNTSRGSTVSHRGTDIASKSCRSMTGSQNRSASLNRCDGINGSTEIIKYPEANTIKTPVPDANQKEIQTKLDDLQLQHNQYVTESKQRMKDLRLQIEQLKESNVQLRSDMIQGQRMLMERLQNLLNEIDDTKKQQAGEAVELSRLRSLLLQLDAKSMLPSGNSTHPGSGSGVSGGLNTKQRCQSGDRVDSYPPQADQEDSMSYDPNVVSQDEDVPREKSNTALAYRNGGDVAVHKSLGSRNVAPPLRPRPNHP